MAGLPGVGVDATPEAQRAAAERLVGQVQAARPPAGRPFIPSPADVGLILRKLLSIGSKLSPKLVLIMAARAVGGLITSDDAAAPTFGADGSGAIWLDMNQADIGDVEAHVTDPRAERFTVGPAGTE